MIERDWEFEKIKKYKENALRENIYNKENIKKYQCCPYCQDRNFIKYMSIFFELLKKGSYTSVNELRKTHIENY